MSNLGRVRTLGDGLYHVIVRTVARDFLIKGKEKDILYGMVRKAAHFGWIQIISFCILNNHLHLVVFVPQRRPVTDEELVERLTDLYDEEKAKRITALWEFRASHGREREIKRDKAQYMDRMFNLSSFVKTFKENFTQSYNRRHTGRIGTVWGGRFKSILLDGRGRELALIVCIYVDLNPVRAGIASAPGLYPESGIGAALRGNRDAMEGILTLGRWVGFANRETSPEQAVQSYLNILHGRAGGKIGSLLKARISVGEKDTRFDPSLRGKEISLFDMLHCRLRCMEKGRMLSGKREDLLKIKGSHPSKSVLPGYHSANALRKTVVVCN